jgi:hypothetical protein
MESKITEENAQRQIELLKEQQELLQAQSKILQDTIGESKEELEDFQDFMDKFTDMWIEEFNKPLTPLDKINATEFVIENYKITAIECADERIEKLNEELKEARRSRRCMVNSLCVNLAKLMVENDLKYITVDTDTGECDARVGITIYCDHTRKKPTALWYEGAYGRLEYVKDLDFDYIKKFARGLVKYLKEMNSHE